MIIAPFGRSGYSPRITWCACRSLIRAILRLINFFRDFAMSARLPFAITASIPNADDKRFKKRASRAYLEYLCSEGFCCANLTQCLINANRTSAEAAIPHFRLPVPVQTVDATPSNTLTRQCFPGRSDLFGCPRSNPSQGSVSADLTLTNDLSFVFNVSVSRVRLECCVDPLNPPG